MSHTPASVANAFLFHGFRDDRPISPMMIQKLLYLAHGYNLCLHNQPLVSEKFEAWHFGPVLPSIYQACKKYVSCGITEYVPEWNDDWREYTPAVPPNDSSSKEVIDFVWQTYGSYDPLILSQWTHDKGGPWDQITKHGLIRRKKIIPDELIHEYFQRLIGDGRVRQSA